MNKTNMENSDGILIDTHTYEETVMLKTAILDKLLRADNPPSFNEKSCLEDSLRVVNSVIEQYIDGRRPQIEPSETD